MKSSKLYILFHYTNFYIAHILEVYMIKIVTAVILFAALISTGNAATIHFGYEQCFDDYIDNWCLPIQSLCQMGSAGACTRYQECIGNAMARCQYELMDSIEDDIGYC